MDHWTDDSGRLKPCPFCGSEAEICRIDGDENAPNFGGVFVQCLNKMCEASSSLIFPCGDDPRPLLIERWNRRPLPPTPHIVPDSECKQGKCAHTTTGCVGTCKLEQAFGNTVIVTPNATSHRSAACGASGGLPGCASKG